MEPLPSNWPFLLHNCYVQEIDEILKASRDKCLPVVNSYEERILVGMVRRKDLQSLARKVEENRVEMEMEEEMEMDDFETQLQLGSSGVQLNVMRAIKKEYGREVSLEERARDAVSEITENIMLDEPMQFASSTPMTFLHLLFITQSIHFGFVTKNGKLVGIVRRIHLEKILRYYGNTN
jgi:hypothetical protein